MLCSLHWVWVVRCSASVGRAPPTVEEVRTWLQAEAASFDGLPDLKGHSITWRLEFRWIPPAADLERLRKEVAGKPDHPERANLEQYENALRGKPTTNRYRLWSKGPGEWRWNQSWGASDDMSHYWDRTLTKKVAWTLLSDQLEIADPSAPFRVGMDLSGLERTVIGADLKRMLYARLPSLRQSNYEFNSPVVHEMGWSVLAVRGGATPDQRLEMTVRGRWDASLTRGFVEELRVVRNDLYPGSVGERTTYSDWLFVPGLERWVAHRVEEYNTKGTLDKVIVFEGATEEQPGEFDLVTQIPPIDGPDPVRGSATFHFVTDHRKGTQLAVDGARGVVGQAVVPGRIGSASSIWNRWLGWLATGLLLLSIAVVVVRRRLVRQ